MREFDHYVQKHGNNKFHEMGRFNRKLERKDKRDIFEIRTNNTKPLSSADSWALQYRQLLSVTQGLRVVLDKTKGSSSPSHPIPFSRMRYNPGRLLTRHRDDTTFGVMLQSVNADFSTNDDLWFERAGKKIHVSLRRNELLVVPGEKGKWDPVYHGVRKVSGQDRFAFIFAY